MRNIRDKELDATQSRCTSCCDFDMNNHSVHNRSPLFANYPTNQHVGSPSPPLGREVLNVTYLLPVKMSFEWIKQGCDFGFHNYARHTWIRHKQQNI